MKRIKLIVSQEGLGSIGDIMEVSDDRAARWVARRLAVLCGGAAEKPNVTTTEPDEKATEAPRGRGRPRKADN